MNTAIHVLPAFDEIDHEPSSHCICGPSAQPVARRDGSNGWLYVHHRLVVEQSDRTWTWVERP